LALLRNFYEEEKDRQEQRISGERDRALKKLVTVQEEYERRLVDEQTAHEDDVELLHDERRESEQRHMALINQVEHDNCLLKQKLDSVAQYIEDKESRFQTELSVL